MKRKSLLFLLLLAIGLPWAAMAQKAIPYSYGFEDNNLATDGWTQQTSNSSSGIYSASSSTHGGTYLFRFQWNENPGYLISPLLTGTNNGVALEFYYANFSSSYNEKFQVGYTTDENVTDPSAFTYGSEITCQTIAPSYTKYENTFPAGTKRIAIKYIYTNGYYLYLDDFSFTAPAPCPKPTDLVCTAYTATTATLSWTENGTATNWVIEYADNANFTGAQTANASGTPSKQLTGLTAEKTYYARVKAICDEDSDWSNTCEFKPSAVQTVTIGDGTSTGYYLPVNTYYYYSLTQQIYTAEEITAAGGSNGTINSISFYHAYTGAAETMNGIQVYLLNTDKAAFANNTDMVPVTESDKVWEGNITLNGAGWVKIDFTTPFDYDGGNLIVCMYYPTYEYPGSSYVFRYTTTTYYSSVYYYSDSSNPDLNTINTYGGSKDYKQHHNNIQLGIIPTSTPKPRNLVVSNITSEGATVTWQAPATGTPTGYEYQYKTSTGEWPASWTNNNSNLTCTLGELTASTDYVVRVRANYAEGDSDPAEIQFTTEASCLPPTGLHVDNIYPYSAVLGWTSLGSGISPVWEICLYPTNDVPQELVYTATTNNNSYSSQHLYPLDQGGLTPNTDYTFFLRRKCSADDVSETASISFRTACGAITSFPINYGFETSEGFPSNASTPTTNQLGTCWRNEATVQNGTNADRVWGTSTTYKHTGSQALVLPDKGNSTNFAKTMLVFPEMEFTNPDGYSVSFWIYRSGSSSNPEGFKLYVSDCDTIGPNAVELGHYSRNYSIAYPDIVTSGWYQYETAPITRTGSVYLIFEGQSYYGSATYVDDITIKEYVTITANQIVNTVSDPATEMTWNEFAQHVNNGDHFTSSTFTLMDDITVSTMVGTSTNPFMGTFNGNSHTITVNLTATDANFTAPFRVIRNATIQNLKVDGTINDGGFKFCAGFAGDCYGNNIFTNCESAVTINATIEGDGTHGGFIARNYGGSSSSSSSLCTTVFNGCAFTGQLLGANTNQVGGFCGWSEYNSPNYAKTIFNNCLFAPQRVTMSTTNSAAFARSRNASYVNFNNCYFMQDFNDGTNNTAQGKQAYTITGVDPVYVAFSGEHTLYNMSGIDAYTVGMIHGYTKLAGEGDVVTLTLDGAPGYEADHGTLVANGDTYTLTMEAFNTQITGIDCPVPYNVAVPAANLTARSAQVTWTGNSDSYTLQYREVITAPVDVNDTYGFEDGTQGWTTIDADGHGNAWSRSTSGGYNSSSCMKATYNSDYAHQDYLVSPQITLGGSLSFYAKKGSSYTDTFRVYLSTSGNTSASDFTIELTDGNVDPTTTYTQYTYDLSGYTGMGYVAIVYTAAADQLSLYVDDITFTNHVDGEYGAWQTVNNAASPQTLSSLTPETTYQVKVSGICAGVETDYSDVVEFSTPASCVAPTGLAVSGITATGASFSWDAEEGATWQYCTFTLPHADPTDADFSSSTTYNTASWTNAFIPSTQQIFWLRKDCGNGEYSQPVSVEFTMLDACVNLTCTAVTTTTATLSWTDNAYGVNSWQIMLNNDAEHLITVTTNPCTLTGLTAATSYTAKVRAAHGNCVGGYTDWSNTVSFATDCDVITITEDNSYRQDFEGYEGTTYSSGDVLPVCWDSYSEGSTLPHITSSGSYHYVHEGTNTLYFYGAAQTNSYVALPEFTNGLNTLQINFWMQTESGTGYGELSLGYITAEDNNFNTYQVIETYENHTSSMVEITTQIKNVPATATRLAFRWAHPSTSWHGCCIDDVEVSLLPNFTKTIEAVGEEGWASGKGGYYFIASPLAENVTPTADNGFIVGDYDLYYFSQTGDGEGNEWINYKPNGAFDLTNGKGYLYASKEGTTLTFTGTPGTNANVQLDNYDATANWAGWNLVGNPFAQTAYINMPFYTMDGGDEYVNHEAGSAIDAMQGVLVHVEDQTITSLTFTTEAPAVNSSKLNMNLRSNNKQLDNAILVFGGDQQLGKMTFRPNSSKIFMPVEGKDYAITTAESNMGEMPVSFKAENNGTYSLSFTSEEVTFAYLHLIDNMTGNDVNLLETPSYTFDARTTDYESRFKLVFATGNNSNDGNFAFFSNGSFVINNDGEATLQVVDVTGRIIKNETINGCANVNVNAAPGVYMLRLVNGDNVKVQKVVVR